MTAMVDHWAKVQHLLLYAENVLRRGGDIPYETAHLGDGGLRGTFQEFTEFLEHDEYELAMEALVALANRFGAEHEFWQAIDQVATMMEVPLPERQSRGESTEPSWGRAGATTRRPWPS